MSEPKPRWRVWRCCMDGAHHPWVASDPGDCDSGETCGCRTFPTQAEALAYASEQEDPR